jgi:molecular chaperone GrpE
MNEKDVHADDFDTITENSQEEDAVSLEPTLEQQLSDMKDQWIRAVAETENIRKRGQREKDEASRYAPSNLARDIVGIADNLRRALETCQKEDITGLSSTVQGLVTGVELIVKELDTILDRHHIKRLMPLHEKFDPNHHQAMFEIESNEHPVGTVLNVMQDGYLLHDRLLRPAMVGVSKASAKADTESEDEVGKKFNEAV